MKVKDRRDDDKLFKMRAANYIKQFITTFFLYLSLRSTDSSNALQYRYLRIIVHLPWRNASALCNNVSWRRDEDLCNYVSFTVILNYKRLCPSVRLSVTSCNLIISVQ